MLILNEIQGPPIKLEWFNHLQIYNKEDIPIEFQGQNFPQYTNYPNLNVAFEKHPFTSSLLQKVVTFDQDLFTYNFCLIHFSRMKT